MKQTAVEWLAIEYNRIDNKWKNVGQGQKHCATEKAEAFEQAKAMEKEQIVNSFEIGYENGACVNEKNLFYHGSNYYNETFKSE